MAAPFPRLAGLPNGIHPTPRCTKSAFVVANRNLKSGSSYTEQPALKNEGMVELGLFELEWEGVEQDNVSLPAALTADVEKWLSSSGFVEKVRLDVTRALELLKKQGAVADVSAIASVLSAQEYRLKIRSSLGARDKDKYLTALRHDVIVISAPGFSDEIFVDISFRGSFVIPRPTQKYASFLQLLPETFVGNKTSLVKLVGLVAAEASTSFKAIGMELPPWRKVKTLLTKWFPVSMEERDLSDSDSDSVSSWSPDTVLPAVRRSPLHFKVNKEIPIKVPAPKPVFGFQVPAVAAF